MKSGKGALIRVSKASCEIWCKIPEIKLNCTLDFFFIWLKPTFQKKKKSSSEDSKGKSNPLLNCILSPLSLEEFCLLDIDWI